MKSRQSSVPEHYRRAIRLFLGVSLPCLLGYGVLLPETHWTYSGGFATACKWSAITCVVVTQPVIGKVAQVGAERSIGTVVGGALGFLVHHVGSKYWNDVTDGIFLSCTAGLVAFTSVVIGNRLKLDLSARLFAITFLLVTFGAQDGKDPLKLAVTRIGGIVSGVLLMVLLSILVLPKSATVECVHNLEKALQCLSKLNELAWRKYLPQQPQQQDGAGGAGSGGAARTLSRARSDGYESLPSEDEAAPRRLPSHKEASAGHGTGEGPQRPGPSLPSAAARGGGAEGKATQEEAEKFELECEKVLTDIYQSLFKLQENTELAKSEVLLGSWGAGHLIFIPGLPFTGLQKHMPWGELDEMATGIRRVARLLLAVISTLDQGFEQDMQEVLGDLYPNMLMQQLAEATQVAIQGMCRDFPNAPTCPPECLARLTVAVHQLVQLSDVQRRRIVRALRGNRHRRFARQAWQRLIDSVRAQSRQAAGGPVPLRHTQSAPPQPLELPRQQAPQPEDTSLDLEAGSGAAGTSIAEPSTAGTASAAGPSGSVPSAQLLATVSAGSRLESALDSAATDANQIAAAAAQVRRDLQGSGVGSRTASEAEALGSIQEGVVAPTAEEQQGPGRQAQEQPTQPPTLPQQQPRGWEQRPARGLAEGAASGEREQSPDSPLRRVASDGPLSSGELPEFRPMASGELERLMGEDESSPGGRGRGQSVEGGGGSSGGEGGGSRQGSAAPQGPRVLRPASGRSDTLRNAMFPETAEGYVAQVRWTAFQFLLEELLEEIVELHEALCASLARLP